MPAKKAASVAKKVASDGNEAVVSSETAGAAATPQTPLLLKSVGLGKVRGVPHPPADTVTQSQETASKGRARVPGGKNRKKRKETYSIYIYKVHN